LNVFFIGFKSWRTILTKSNFVFFIYIIVDKLYVTLSYILLLYYLDYIVIMSVYFD